MSDIHSDLTERDAIEQKVMDGDLCPTDGKPHDWQEYRERYGDDRDGNRGNWVTFRACSKCGEGS